MKGQITITVNEGNRLNFHGNLLLKNNIERYEIISGLSKCLGINDPSSWAECVVYCLGRIPDMEGMNRTEIVIPNFGGESK